MALTMPRWIALVTLLCTVMVVGFASRDHVPRRATSLSADSVRLRELQLRVSETTVRWEALARRDRVLADLAARGAPDTGRLSIRLDSLLPNTHRSIIERAVRRQWSSLHLDGARVPVAIVVVIDTAISLERLTSGRGRIAYDYLMPAPAPSAGQQRCVAIISLHAPSLVREGTHRALAELVATTRSASSLLGPCAFVARFGPPGAQIDRWLRERSYELAAYPEWWSLPVMGADPGENWRRANTGIEAPRFTLSLSPAALGCASGRMDRCSEALSANEQSNASALGSLLIMQRGRDRHWGAMSGRYVSDLVTALGPERFERFWRSDLSPDAALRGSAALSIDAWTHTWAVGLVGEQRVGPAVSLAEVMAVLSLAGLSLALAAWGWSRRQVR
jgi:hypothetical protein